MPTSQRPDPTPDAVPPPARPISVPSVSRAVRADSLLVTAGPRTDNLGRRAASAAILIVLGTIAGLILLITEVTLGTAVLASALSVAIVPLPAYLAIVLLMDRFEPEPRWMLAIAFLWGASVAVFGAGVLNGIVEILFGEQASAVVGAPIVEESVKAVVLFAFFFMKRDEFDGVVDGVVYAAMVGLGFALMENVDYYSTALVREGPAGLAVSFGLRGVMSPFAHPLFTAMSGIGLGLAEQTGNRWMRWLAPPAGLVAAMGLHAMWNAGIEEGLAFFAVYAIVMIPLLVGVFAVVAFSLRREGRIVAARLAPEARSGLLHRAELRRLSSMSDRILETLAAWGRHGRPGLEASRAYHHAASELAFCRQRAIREQRPDQGGEARLVEAFQSARQRFQHFAPPGH